MTGNHQLFANTQHTTYNTYNDNTQQQLTHITTAQISPLSNPTSNPARIDTDGGAVPTDGCHARNSRSGGAVVHRASPNQDPSRSSEELHCSLGVYAAVIRV